MIEQSIARKVAGIALILIFLALMTVGNYRFCSAQPGGSDFLFRWLPTRIVLTETGSSPYTEEISNRVEIVDYGRLAQDNEPPGYFAYPYYTMLPFLPFALLPNYALARALWMTLLECAYLGCLFLSLKLTNAKLSMGQQTLLGVFLLFNANFTQGLVDGNPAGLAALFFFLSLYFIRTQQDRAAGIFLALSTMKPQMVILGCVFIFLWSIVQRRWLIVLYVMLGMALLFGGSLLFHPQWLSDFYHQITSYTGYASPSTPKAILGYWMPAGTANLLSRGLTIVSITMMLFYWWKSRKGNFEDVVLAVAVTFTLMPFTGITSAKSNFITLILLAVLLVNWSTEVHLSPWWLTGLIAVSLVTSWVYRYHGPRSTNFFFFDFYPLPLTLLGLLLLSQVWPRRMAIINSLGERYDETL
ncbi:MAG: glycosyltransferase family 87 protein [Anaerolineae bacterium]|jgi:hypothetical protein|nr:glycosyltransferase family 87 protein [Anaerolineae bacterium]